MRQLRRRFQSRHYAPGLDDSEAPREAGIVYERQAGPLLLGVHHLLFGIGTALVEGATVVFKGIGLGLAVHA